jgi:hypothetical protein
LIILARTLLRGPSALLGRSPVLRNLGALLLALTAGLPGCVFTHGRFLLQEHPNISHAGFLGPANKTGRFPGPSISSLRLTLWCRPEENFHFIFPLSRPLQED